MEMERNVGNIFSDILNQKAKSSKMAVTSMLLGFLAPCCFFAVWIVSFFSSHGIINVGRYILTAFSCSLAWILGLVLGMISLKQIRNSEQHLIGRAYAVVGVSISAIWIALLVVLLYYLRYFTW
jgi:ABC-type antimicrobial peptide transport system permease subunit